MFWLIVGRHLQADTGVLIAANQFVFADWVTMELCESF